MGSGAAFVGREAEIEALADLVADHDLITVTGPGGVGKTRFSLEAAEQLSQKTGVTTRFVSLADLPAGADVDAISAATGMASPEALAVSLGETLSANLAIRSGRWEEAKEEIEAAQAATAAIDDGWWGGTVLRSRALFTAYEAAEKTEADGWEASRDDWRRAVERAAGIGDLSELGFALRAAAVVAARAGHEEVALSLIGAAPSTREFTVLPELFDEERHRLEEQRPATRAGAPQTTVEALRVAMQVLGDDPDDPDDDPGDGRVGDDVPDAALVLEGDVWALTFEGTTTRVRQRKGLADIAVLLSRPEADVHCLELMGADEVGGDAGPALDERARREYQTRILDLQGDVDEAREANDPARAERAEAELDALVDQLSSAFGLGGRSRATGSSAERARTAVTYRIRAAIKAVGEQHPPLQRHLASSVKTGTWCSYRPERPQRWRIEGASTG